jgi:hypothetical protein
LNVNEEVNNLLSEIVFHSEKKISADEENSKSNNFNYQQENLFLIMNLE